MIAGCGQSDTASPLFVPTPPPPVSPSTRPYRPLPTWDTHDPALQERFQIAEATYIAVLTNVPQATVGPRGTRTPHIWPTQAPIPTNVLYPAGEGRILEDGGTRLLSGTGVFKNQWQRDVGDQEIRVYFGADLYNGNQGLLVVGIFSRGEAPVTEVYRTPMLAGSIRAIGAVGEKLTVKAKDGIIFEFDLPTRTWIFPQGTPSAVVQTPMPTANPLP
jgi:hypothetical protein